MDFSLAEEVVRLSEELGRFAEKELRPRMRDFEEAGAWSADVLRALDGFALPALDQPEERGGVGAGLLAKVVALEAVAWGDAGGLLAADASGPAAAALLACPDRERAREVAGDEGTQLLVVGERARV